MDDSPAIPCARFLRTNEYHNNIKRGSKGTHVLFASTADRQLHLFDPDDDFFTLLESVNDVHDSPILSCTTLHAQCPVTITTSMSGQVILYDHTLERVIDERRDHKKYVVKAARFQHKSSTWVATAGWDAMIFLYQLRGDVLCGTCSLGDPVASVSLATDPETATFLTHPESDLPMLLVTRRDSTSLHYNYYLGETTALTTPTERFRLLGSQDLAPHSNAWISFSPSCVAVSPIDQTLLAVATSAVPYMKLIIVRLLFPPLQLLETTASNERTTQASQARQRLAIQDREDAAITLHVSTFAPRTPYFRPQLCWRPDGSGAWINGDDGVLHGLEATTGKVWSTLRGGHEPGSKIRSAWAGMVDMRGVEEEWLVSGGFDKRLAVWKPMAEEIARYEACER
ncbi:MAG: hypothetical protein Q9184_003495 [Pyrenodesmia sp. 2 TL-2023]